MSPEVNDVFESSTTAELEEMFYKDTESEVAELSGEELQEARDVRDSLRYYRRRNRERGQGGWKRNIERCESRLEELCGCTDVDELDEALGTKEDDEADESEAELLRERAEWYDSHGWAEMAEREYDRLAELTGDG